MKQKWTRHSILPKQWKTATKSTYLIALILLNQKLLARQLKIAWIKSKKKRVAPIQVGSEVKKLKYNDTPIEDSKIKKITSFLGKNSP